MQPRGTFQRNLCHQKAEDLQASLMQNAVKQNSLLQFAGIRFDAKKCFTAVKQKA
jgi:hypothetical protein